MGCFKAWHQRQLDVGGPTSSVGCWRPKFKSLCLLLSRELTKNPIWGKRKSSTMVPLGGMRDMLVFRRVCLSHNDWDKESINHIQITMTFALLTLQKSFKCWQDSGSQWSLCSMSISTFVFFRCEESVPLSKSRTDALLLAPSKFGRIGNDHKMP